MPQYKNVGKSPWRRPTGELVAPGGVFEATVREQQRIQRRGYRGRLEKVDTLPPSPAVVAAAATTSSEDKQSSAPSTKSDAAVATVETLAGWSLKMTPQTYLKLHPSGGHAPLARQIVAAVTKEEDSGDKISE